MDQLRVALLFGGTGEEHDISIKSAKEIAKYLRQDYYEIYFIGVTKDGQWRLLERPENFDEESGKKVILSSDSRDRGIYIVEDNCIQIKHLDVLYPVIHGKMGEDGTLQGLMELSKIPYVGCKLMPSVIGMDKSYTHLVANAAQVDMPMYLVADGEKEVLELEKKGQISYPVFVKPARSGSSFGVSKVETRADLLEAVREAFVYDHKILLEEAIEGDEVGCAILSDGDHLITGEVDQIIVENGFFRIHQEKNPEQGSQNARIGVPARISKDVAKKVKDTAKRIYRAMGCTGLARVDLFLQKDGKILLNEVNTMPGCTCYSRYPRMMVAAGISMEHVVETLIREAMQDKE